MIPEDFDRAAAHRKEYAVTHRATVDDVQKALHLIVKAGFDVDAMAPEHIRRGREILEEMMKKHPEMVLENAPEHGYSFRRGDERLMLTWNYEDNTAEIILDKRLPGEPVARIGDSRTFSLSEFAAYVAAGQDPDFQRGPSPAPR